MKNLFMPFVFAAVAAGCSTLTPSESPVNLKVTDLEARVIRIERVVENQSLVQLAGELDQVRAETQKLRGELEQLRYETENNANRQRELYVDVDRRLQALETSSSRSAATPPPAPAGGGFAAAAPVPPPVQPPPVAAAPAPTRAPAATASAAARPSGSDRQDYQAAFDLVQARKYPEAGKAFGDFLTSFPQSPLADNAQYWLGETYYVQRDFKTALAEFKKVLDVYPKSAKLPDAMLKVGYCEVELGNKDGARTSFQQVMRQFPDTTSARLASQRLERLSQ